jgi:acetoin utilization protein AcuC
MELSESSHAMAASSLCRIANSHCDGKLIALGGGGYNLENIAKAWTAVVQSLVDEL